VGKIVYRLKSGGDASLVGFHYLPKDYAIIFVKGGREMVWQDRIVVDPEVLVGKPAIKGTRMAVEFIVSLLAQGWSEAEILKNYPGLTKEDILACLSYASEVLHEERIYPVGAKR
jgi:uncharacterized protein (DUF433 family)